MNGYGKKRTNFPANRPRPQQHQMNVGGAFGGGDEVPLPVKVDRWGWFNLICCIFLFLVGLTSLILLSILFARSDDHNKPCKDDDGRWKCEGPFQSDPPPEECPRILYSPIAFGFEFELCWFGQCTYFKEANPISLDWPCIGPDNTRAELKIHGAGHCLDYISNQDQNKTRFTSFLTCFNDDALCVYHEKCAEYSWITDFEVESFGGESSTENAHHNNYDQFHHHSNIRNQFTSSNLALQSSIDGARSQLDEVNKLLGGKSLLQVAFDELKHLKAEAAASQEKQQKHLAIPDSSSDDL